MKSRYIINMFGAGALTLLLGQGIVSCTDVNEWDTDSAFDRLFGTRESALSITPDALTALVEWEATPNTKYYIIEASLDSLYDEVPMGANGSLVYGEDGSITKSPYTLTGLMGETTYYLRIKSVADNKESRWVYPEEFKFTTDEEQILNTPAEGEVTDEGVLLTWEAGLEVTHITYQKEDGTGGRHDVTEEEKAAGSVQLTGLDPKSTYTICIFNGDTQRGEIEVTTNAAVEVASTISDITQTSAVFSWDENVGRLTGYVVLKGDVYPTDEEQTLLTSEEESTHTLTIKGLEPSTTYTVAVMRDKVVRARQVFSTAMGIPSDYTQVTLTSRDDWADVLNNNSGKVAIIIPQGTTIDLTANTSFQTEIPEAITSLLMWGEEGGAEKSTFKTRGLSLVGTKTDVKFYNLNVESNGTSNYIFRQKGNGQTESLSFEDCNISNAAGVFCARDNDAAGGSLSNLSFNNCVITNIGNYSVVYSLDSYTLTKISMKNSTLNGCTGNIFRVAQSAAFILEVQGVTFYNSAQAIIRCDAYNVDNVFTMTDVLISKVNTSTPNNNNCVAGVNVYTTSDCYAVNWATRTSLADADLFEDPANGNFRVKVADYVGFGDPRWNK